MAKDLTGQTDRVGVNTTWLTAAPTRALILAAGRGQRLRPYTDHTPKPLLPILGRPTLDYILEATARAGVVEVCLVVGHLGEQIRAFVGDGRRWGVRVQWVHQPQPCGTADAARLAASFLTVPSFILAADYALPPDHLLALKRAYLTSGCDVAVSLKPVPAERISQSSSARFDADGRLTAIVEKPAPGTAPSLLGVNLIYITPPDVTTFLEEVTLSPRGEYEMPTVINAMLSAGLSVIAWQQAAPPEWSPESGSMRLD